MSSTGPQLPPPLTKRRRDSGDDDDSASSSNKHPRRGGAAQPLQNQDAIDVNASSSDSEDDYAPPRPSALPAPASAAARTAGPSLPPHMMTNNNDDEISLSDSDSDTGPPPPPLATTATNPNFTTNPDSDSSEDDDDDFGPSLPSASAPRARQIGPSLPPSEFDDAPKRDEWMLAPPPSSSTFSERDTTRIRARKFASKPSTASSSAAGAGGPSIWTETPEEKLKRLQDSVLGRTSAGASGTDAGGDGLTEKQRKKQLRDEALSADIHAKRGKTLLEEHQGGKKKAVAAGAVVREEEEEDDPSKRAFDKEKDMAIGGRITATQRRELVNKSANFGGRFQKGSFL